MLASRLMRHRLLFLLGVLVVATPSCGNNRCSGIYNCPAGVSEVLVPADLTAPVSSVTAEAPCAIGSLPPFTNRISVNISGERTGTCTVRALLSDGTQLTQTLSFEPLMCCGSSVAPTATFTIAGTGTGDDATAD